MGITVKTRLLIVRLKSWWKSSRYKKLEWKVRELDRVHNAIAQSLTMLVEENVKNVYSHFSEFESNIKKDNKTRKAQSTRLLKKVDKLAVELAVNVKESNANFKFMNDKLKKLDAPIKKIDEVDELVVLMKKELASFRKLNEKLEILDGIHDKVKVDYDRYLKDLTDYHKTHIEMLHRDISEYKKNDNAVVRLSSLETRITMLELNHKDKVKSSNVHSMENRIGN